MGYPLAGVRRTLVAISLAAAAVAVLAAPAGARERIPATFPFAPPKDLRAETRRDALPSLFKGGGRCSVGCRAPRAVRGWPLRPFRSQHVLRAGLNELRTRNLHIGVDVLAKDGSSVYAIQPGRAQIFDPLTPDSHVQVGRFVYWHIRPLVLPGQYVRPHSEVLGTVVPGQSHLHLSELVGRRFVNPLRPRGRALAPWSDRARPVLGRPKVKRDGEVTLRAFDPQSDLSLPVLGLAGLAYRVSSTRGRRGPLRWAYRGTTHLRNRLRRRIYAPGTSWPRARCLMRRRRRCRPNWIYRLAGGLAPPLRLRRGRRYLLSAYGWDWAGNVTVLDSPVIRTRRGYRRLRATR